MKPKKCPVCKKKFNPSNTLQKYCSYSCSYEAQKQRAKKKARKERSVSGINKLDDLWSKLVKERDGACVYCGKTTYLNAHHIYSRSNRSTRWYLPNGITLCPAHHTFSSTFSAHKTPAEFVDWLREIKGDNFLEDLKNEKKKIDKHDNQYWLDQLQE